MKRVMKLLGAAALCMGMLVPMQAEAARWLLVGEGIDATNTLEAKLTAKGTETFVVENGLTAGARTLADLTANFDIIVVGVQGPSMNDAGFQASVTGGAIENWVNAGGVAVFNLAHNAAVDVTGPGGSVFHSWQVSGTTSNLPTITDLDHEYILGTFSAAPVTLVDADFQNWGTSLHGQVSPPAGFVDAVGRNLGTSPVTGQFNEILASPVSGTSGVTHAQIEYVLGNGYVLANMQTYDWGTRPAVAATYDQMIDYLIGILPNFPIAAAAPAAPAALGGGGGGCALNTQADFDPMLPVLALLALGFLYRRRNNV